MLIGKLLPEQNTTALDILRRGVALFVVTQVLSSYLRGVLSSITSTSVWCPSSSSTCSHADAILFLEGGRIVERRHTRRAVAERRSVCQIGAPPPLNHPLPWRTVPMADPESIYNWRRLDERTTTSGQPTEAQLADIHALGVRHIVNLGLHTSEKALPDEAASVSRLGMTYIHIPVDFQNPTDQDFEQFCSAMERLKDVPVHVHCIANYRVSAFFYRYRRDVLGMDESQARADMEAIWRPEGAWAAFVDG